VEVILNSSFEKHPVLPMEVILNSYFEKHMYYPWKSYWTVVLKNTLYYPWKSYWTVLLKNILYYPWKSHWTVTSQAKLLVQNTVHVLRINLYINFLSCKALFKEPRISQNAWCKNIIWKDKSSQHVETYSFQVLSSFSHSRLQLTQSIIHKSVACLLPACFVHRSKPIGTD
jgi:hypothetical protein